MVVVGNNSKTSLTLHVGTNCGRNQATMSQDFPSQPNQAPNQSLSEMLQGMLTAHENMSGGGSVQETDSFVVDNAESDDEHVLPAANEEAVPPQQSSGNEDVILALLREVGSQIERVNDNNQDFPLEQNTSSAYENRVTKSGYTLPAFDLLRAPDVVVNDEQVRLELADKQLSLLRAFQFFGIEVTPADITRKANITRYEFRPHKGVQVKSITALRQELKAATRSTLINILAPVPGKDTIGIEIENEDKSPVYLRELIQSGQFQSPKLRIPVALGRDMHDNPVISDLASMRHLLMSGTTGSGKSICISSLIISLLYKFSPDDLKLILIDPKAVEMQFFKRLPHLACPIATNASQAIGALRWAVSEVEHRYKLFGKIGVRNLDNYHTAVPSYISEEELLNDDDDSEMDWVDKILFDFERKLPIKLPYVVIVIDGLLTLMSTAPDELLDYIARLAQKAHAAGIYLVVSTLPPRRNALSGAILSNIVGRIAFQMTSALDSRIVFNRIGAENLNGKGDMLFAPAGGTGEMVHIQGAFVSDNEISAVVKHCAKQGTPSWLEDSFAVDNSLGRISTTDVDEQLYSRCVNLVVTERRASTSLLQRRFSIGYGQAAKIMDMMEARGVISPPQGVTRERKVLIDEP